MKIPSKFQIWSAFWHVVGRIVLNKTFLLITLLVTVYLVGVGTSRIVLNTFFDTGSTIVKECNTGLEKVGIAYRLDMPDIEIPQAIPVIDDQLFTNDTMLLPPLNNSVVRN